jgi:hypothetical protein
MEAVLEAMGAQRIDLISWYQCNMYAERVVDDEARAVAARVRGRGGDDASEWRERWRQQERGEGEE